jgi:hypothetical protein
LLDFPRPSKITRHIQINLPGNRIVIEYIGNRRTSDEMMEREQGRNEPLCSDEILKNSLVRKNAKSPGYPGLFCS